MTEIVIPQKKLDPVWLKASVVGGLWATVEIIIGSFFHNLRIPFAGSFLAMNGTVLLIAFYHLWPEKGLAWRAGLICALMKSISPSAVILGPMIGIMMEALIIEFFLRFFGKNLLSLSIAGVLSVSSALFHKIASIIILYGFNIVNIYVDIFHFFAKQVKIENAQPITLILIVLSAYVLLGIISAIIGFVIGRRSTSVALNGNMTMPGQITTQNILSIDPRQKFSILSFFIHLTIIPAGLIILNLLNTAYALPFILIYSVYSILMYKRSLRRLMKPVFWIQLLLIVLLASINWKGLASGGSTYELNGLRLGLEMVLRAVFIVVAFSSLSVELRNPVIRDALFRKGFEKIYLALGLSFSALPIMIEAMPRPKFFLRHPVRSFSNMMLQAKEWLITFEKSNENMTGLPDR
jgi:hypothetical protein